MSFADWVTAVAAVSGAAIAAFSTVQAKGSSQAANEAAKLSADAARNSAETAKAIRMMAAEQRHDELRPEIPSELMAQVHRAQLPAQTWRVRVTLKRDYRIAAYAISRANPNAEKHLIGMQVQRRDDPLDLFLDPVSNEATILPDAKEIVFRLWPPLSGDLTDDWTCPCDRPRAEGTPERGHWEIRTRIRYGH